MSDSVTPWTVACQAPLSMGFSRQEYWSGLSWPPSGDLPDPGMKPASPALQMDSLPPNYGGIATPFSVISNKTPPPTSLGIPSMSESQASAEPLPLKCCMLGLLWWSSG